jgi:hypothetical protein
VQPKKGKPGTDFALRGKYFRPGQRVRVTVAPPSGEPRSLSLRSDAAGEIQLALDGRPGEGRYRVSARARGRPAGAAEAEYTVT